MFLWVKQQKRDIKKAKKGAVTKTSKTKEHKTDGCKTKECKTNGHHEPKKRRSMRIARIIKFHNTLS